MRTLIENGTIVDGSGRPGYAASLVIEDECLAAIGSLERGSGYDRVIDAAGMMVAPGFIDSHSHSDLELLVNPYIEAKVRQGVTTELLGQDGISMAPLPKKHISPWRKNLAGLEGESDALDWEYETTEGYLVGPGGVGACALQHRPAQRGVGAGVGHNAHPHRGQLSVLIARRGVLHLHRVPLGMHAQTLSAAQRELHRPPAMPRQQRRMMLY